MVWKWLYNQQFGLLNNVLGTNAAWISDPKIAWISIGIIRVWSVIGYNMILFRVVCACLTATMAGYAFGRLRFPGKNFFFGLVLVQMMIPAQISIIPQYLILILNKNLYHLSQNIPHSFVGLLDIRQYACVVRRALRNISMISD